jgi:hypothetical protein
VSWTRGSVLPSTGTSEGPAKGSSPEEDVLDHESCRHSRTAAVEEVLVVRVELA